MGSQVEQGLSGKAFCWLVVAVVEHREQKIQEPALAAGGRGHGQDVGCG